MDSSVASADSSRTIACAAEDKDMPLGAASIALWLVIRCRISVVAFGTPSAAQRDRFGPRSRCRR